MTGALLQIIFVRCSKLVLNRRPVGLNLRVSVKQGLRQHQRQGGVGRAVAPVVESDQRGAQGQGMGTDQEVRQDAPGQATTAGLAVQGVFPVDPSCLLLDLQGQMLTERDPGTEQELADVRGRSPWTSQQFGIDHRADHQRRGLAKLSQHPGHTLRGGLTPEQGAQDVRVQGSPATGQPSSSSQPRSSRVKLTAS